LVSDGGMLKQCLAPKPLDREREEEIAIAGLLGDYMPGAEIPGAGESTSSENAPSMLLPHFMSLRLLLLGSPESRTQEENDMLAVIRKSYTGFSQDSSRSKKDLAHLLARDWRFLRMTADNDKKMPATTSVPTAAPDQQPYQSHVMSAPTVSTFAMMGMPVSMPSMLGSVDSVARRPSFDDVGMMAKKRRISSSSFDASGR